MKHVTILLVMFAWPACAAAQEAPRPNIIFIFGDDWGYGDLGCYGHTELKTPNLDRLAREGTRYTQFYVTSGVCSPSRTSVITGHYPDRHRVFGHFAGNDRNEARGMPNWLDPAAVSLPRLMQSAGYKTAHFGKWHLGGGGLPHGDPSAPLPAEYGYDETRVWNGNGPTWNGTALWPSVRYMDSDKVWAPASSELAVDATIRFVEAHKEGPFYVNLWLKDPHEPLWPTDEQRAPYANAFDDPKECYYAVLTDADRHIGRLLDKLDALGLTENTLVIFSSDNGPENLNDTTRAGITAGLTGRKRYFHEGGVRVPFIVRWPGHTPAGGVDTRSVLSTVDFMPTFCALAGAALPGDYAPDGVDMRAALEAKPFTRNAPLYWRKYFGSKDNWPGAALRMGGWKLLRSGDGGKVALHNMLDDPFEEKNLAAARPELAKELSEKLDAWIATLPEGPTPQPYSP